MTYKIIVINLIILLLLPFLSGCNEAVPTKLNFRITWEVDSSRGELISEVVHQYNETQDSVNVKVFSGNEDKTMIIDALMNSDSFVCVLPYRYLKDNDIAQYLDPLNDRFDDSIQDYHQNLIPLSYNDNDLLGIPWIGHSMALLYNKGIVQAADVDPKDWTSLSDMLEGVSRVETASKVSGIGLVGADQHDLSWMTAQFIYSFGGALAQIDAQGNDQILIDSPQSAQALDFYINKLGAHAQTGWQNHTGSDVMEAFAREEIAFEIQGPWGVSDIWKRGHPFEVGVIALGDFGLYSEVGPMMLVIPKQCADKDSAEAFIRFMIQKDNLNQIMTGEYSPKYGAYYPFRVPIHREADQSDFFLRYPDFYPFIEGFNHPSISTPTSRWAELQEDHYTKLIHQVIVEEMTIAEALEEMNE